MTQNNIRIILHQTSHPGNIGATARAMWTMGLDCLCLVSPKSFPDPIAVSRAAGSEHILEKALIVETLDEALADCGIIIGTSAQNRHLPWPQLSPKECAQKVASESSQQMVGILFGPERTGLSNEDLQRCHYQVAIPANPEYSSLNLAMAVQVICYEIYGALLDPTEQESRLLANDAQMQSFFLHLDKLLDAIHFRKPTSSPDLMPKLKRIFNRAQLDEDDINLLRGVFKKICNDQST
ncbi:MAG: RNA methyltransferase [Legionellales bacterium]|jgi:tRNA (cytidine32/uridine32-2'-O)-methyltransferase